MRSLRDHYGDHKSNARKKGVQFKLSFEQWLRIWVESGHLEERGRHRGQYVMGRFGDKGAYEIGNVKILPHIENIKERKFSEETIARIAASRIGKPHLGPKRHSDETKLAISLAKTAYWARKKEESIALHG